MDMLGCGATKPVLLGCSRLFMPAGGKAGALNGLCAPLELNVAEACVICGATNDGVETGLTRTVVCSFSRLVKKSINSFGCCGLFPELVDSYSVITNCAQLIHCSCYGLSLCTCLVSAPFSVRLEVLGSGHHEGILPRRMPEKAGPICIESTINY